MNDAVLGSVALVAMRPDARAEAPSVDKQPDLEKVGLLVSEVC